MKEDFKICKYDVTLYDLESKSNVLKFMMIDFDTTVSSAYFMYKMFPATVINSIKFIFFENVLDFSNYSYILFSCQYLKG